MKNFHITVIGDPNHSVKQADAINRILAPKKSSKKSIWVYCHFRKDGTLLAYCKHSPANDCTVKVAAWEYPDGSIRLCY